MSIILYIPVTKSYRAIYCTINLLVFFPEQATKDETEELHIFDLHSAAPVNERYHVSLSVITSEDPQGTICEFRLRFF